MRASARAHAAYNSDDIPFFFSLHHFEKKPLAAMICDNDVQWECDLIILAWIFTFFSSIPHDLPNDGSIRWSSFLKRNVNNSSQ